VASEKEDEQLQGTTIPSLLNITRSWYFLDLKNKIVGKEATGKIVDLLRGKNRRDFTPNSDLGNYVVLVNAKHMSFTGNKLDKKNYYNHSGYPGGLRTRSARLMLESYPTELAFRIIRGMIPHTKLGDKQAGRLFIFAEEKHNLSTGKNYQKYQQFAPDESQTDAWSSGQIVDMWRGIYLDSFELVEIIEDYNKGGDNKLILKIKERKITTSGFSPTINYLLINFGTTGAGMHEYATELQVGKKYHFNGDNLENTKILIGKQLDLNNSVDKIPEIRVFNEEGEIITHGPIVPTNGSKPPTNNQKPTNSKLANLKIIFQKLDIKKIIFENGKLTIEFNNQQTNSVETITDNQEYSAIKKYCQEHNKKELTSHELTITATSSNNSTPNNNNHQLLIGRRKEATARVYLKEGKGQAQIRTNDGKEKDLKDYFYMEPSLCEDIYQPLKLFSKENAFDFFVRVKGSGFHSQAKAIRLGVARALLNISPEYKITLKSFSLLTRDARRVERKK
ncbi:22042_t:CDS:2, partial [Entrophospora sp. SA101]